MELDAGNPGREVGAPLVDRGALDGPAADRSAPDMLTWLPELSQVTTFAGTGVSGHKDGPLATAQLNMPHDLLADSSGGVYVVDRGNHVIRHMRNGTITTLAGTPGTAGHQDGAAATARFRQPTAFDRVGTRLYISEASGQRVRVLDLATMQVSTLAGSGTAGFADGVAQQAQFDSPHGVVVVGGTLYVADLYNHRIRAVDTATGVVTTCAGDGTAEARDGAVDQARFKNPHGLALAPTGEIVVSDKESDRVRLIDLKAGQVTTLAGGTAGAVDGPCASASFNGPSDVAFFAGHIVVADHYSHRIRLIAQQGCAVTTLAGSTAGYADGPLATALFQGPEAVLIDEQGRILVADTDGHRIRRIE